MNSSKIIEALEKWNFWHQTIDTGVSRTKYLQKMTKLAKIPEVIAFVGIRRSGKSVFCYQILEGLLETKVPKENTLFVNFEDPVFGEIVSLKELKELFESYLEFKNPKGRIYLFLDEVQKVEGWERFVLSLHDSHQNVKIFVTGSNSTLLEDKISTLLSGRYITLRIYPLDFQEFLEFKKIDVKKILNKSRILNLLREFLKFGGFPRVVLEKERIVKNSLLQEYYNTILEKDVILRNNIRSKTEIKDLGLYVMSSVGTLISTYALSKKIGINHQNVMSYLNFFEEAFLINRVSKYDVSVKKQIYNPDKIFVADTGLAHIAGFAFSENIGHYLENLVFNRCSSQNKKIYYYKNRTEADFVIKEGIKVKEIINVCFSLKDKDTLDREIKSFEEMKKHFPYAALKLIYWEKDEDLIIPKNIQTEFVLDNLCSKTVD